MPDADQLKAYLADRDVSCPGCGYNLRGVAELVCPECGFELALQLRQTSTVRDRHVRRLLVSIPFTMGALGLVAILMWVVYYFQFGAVIFSASGILQVTTITILTAVWIAVLIRGRRGMSVRLIRILGWSLFAYAGSHFVAMVISMVMP